VRPRHIIVIGLLVPVFLGCPPSIQRVEDCTPGQPNCPKESEGGRDMESATKTEPGTPMEIELTVKRHQSVTFADARVDTILADASDVAQKGRGSDVACGVTLKRKGAVETFDEPGAVINSEADFRRFMNAPGHVKIIQEINWCGGFIPNVLGCADVPGKSLVVVDYNDDLEGIMWLHELGHNKGLSHRNDKAAVMYPSLGRSRLGLLAGECRAYRGEPGAAVRASGAISEGVKAEDFVRQAFVEGMPYEEASKYGSGDVDGLLRMLDKDEDKPHWANVVVMLGMIGDEKAVEPLIGFFEKEDAGTLDRAHYAAKAAVPMALGYVANKTGSDKAIGYLSAWLDPTTRKAPGGTWKGPLQSDVPARNGHLTRMATLGLALSGKQKALTSLEAAKARVGVTDALLPDGALLDAATRAATKIQDKGLGGYYGLPSGAAPSAIPPPGP